MSVREYIGARYVPLFMGEWDNTKTYEPLSIVIYQGNSYTSRQYVPIGIEITNEIYWAETGNYNAQVEQYRQEVLGFNGRITAIESDNWVTTQRINDGAVTFDKLSEFVQNMGSNIENHVTTYYIDRINGNDETAIPGDITKPYKTLDAAAKLCDITGGNLRFSFLTSGNYTFTARIITGSVIHMFADDIAENDTNDLVINVVNDYGTFFAYDTHINLNGTSKNHLVFNLPSDENPNTTVGMLEIEGSTLWCHHTTFNCKYLYLIQGSARLAEACTINGRVDMRFANFQAVGLTINNTQPNPAIYAIESVLRFEQLSAAYENPFSLEITDNVNASNINAIRIFNSIINLNSTCQTHNRVRSYYEKFLEARGSIVYAGESVWAALWNYAQTGPLITSEGTLITTNRFKCQGRIVLSENVAPNTYHDEIVLFPYNMQAEPKVMITPLYSGTAMDFTNVGFSILDISSTGFTCRIFNGSDSDKHPAIEWIAMT